MFTLVLMYQTHMLKTHYKLRRGQMRNSLTFANTPLNTVISIVSDVIYFVGWLSIK